ncbi:MAG: PEP-CTERM sorting domain-containing protein [Burkholderiaceae bacterium]
MQLSISRSLGAVALCSMASFAYANTTHDAFVDPADSVSFDGFNTLSSSRITAANLVSGITSNVAGSGDATFTRTSGAHYPATGGLYSFSGPSTFEVADSTVTANVDSVVFQSFVNISNGADGVWGLLSPQNLPTLSYNGGNQSLAATTQFTEPVPYLDSTFTPVPADPDNPNYARFTWDLSGVGAPITSYTIDFGLDAHSQALAFQVNQVVAVPEPEAFAMMALGMGVIGFVARRRRESGSASGQAATA